MDVQLRSVFSAMNWYVLLGVTIIIVTVLWKRLNQPYCKGRRDFVHVSATPFLMSLLIAIVYRSLEQMRAVDIADYLFPILSGLCHLHFKDKAIQGSWAGKRYICCYDATISEKIFQSSTAINKDWLYKLLEPWLGTGLLTSADNKWRARRKMLTPAFHFRILKDFLAIFNQHSKVLVENLEKNDGEILDITTTVPLCTLDIIAETAMGVRLNAQAKEAAEYVEAIKHLTSSTVKPFTTPWYWITPIYNLSPVGRERRKNLKIVHEFGRNVIRKRKQEILEDGLINEVYDDFQDFGDDIGTKKRRALLDLLLYHHLTDNSFTEEDIREEVDTFMFEGHDTTSMAICWSLYLLGLHKDIQEKAYKELSQICGEDKDREVTTEDLKTMKYLDCVVKQTSNKHTSTVDEEYLKCELCLECPEGLNKETLRLFPSVPFILRRTSKDIEAGDYVIPANSSVCVYILGIHHDHEIYPNPDVFDPDRFLPENCIGRHPFAYVPFSAGFRNCIGQRFAMMEVKTVLCYVIRNFIISSLDHRDKINFVGDIILRPTGELRLTFQKR